MFLECCSDQRQEGALQEGDNIISSGHYQLLRVAQLLWGRQVVAGRLTRVYDKMHIVNFG